MESQLFQRSHGHERKRIAVERLHFVPLQLDIRDVFFRYHAPRLESGRDGRLLARVVDAWPALNGSLRMAILAIVEGPRGVDACGPTTLHFSMHMVPH